MAKPTSVRLPDDLAAKLDQLATAMERPRAWVIEQAIARYIDDELEDVLAIREARDEYEAGRSVLIPHEEAMRRIEDMLKAYQTRDADRVA